LNGWPAVFELQVVDEKQFMNKLTSAKKDAKKLKKTFTFALKTAKMCADAQEKHSEKSGKKRQKSH
jgi:hypothetical protein